MKTENRNGKTIILLEGRIDSNNANQIGDELLQYSGKDVELDVTNLNYISSAGLRVLLKLKKTMKDSLVVNGASAEIYNIFEVTGFSEIFDIRRIVHEISVEGLSVIGQGGEGTIYRIDDDKIVKLYNTQKGLEDLNREKEYARTALVHGVPCVIAYDVVKSKDRYGLVFELIKSDTLGHAIKNDPDNLEEYVDKYVELAKELHSTRVPVEKFKRIHETYHLWASKLTPWASQEEIDVLHDIIDSIPDSDTITHNDLHPGNIMIQNGELLLIDMPAVTVGPGVCDLIGIYRDMVVGPNSETPGELIESTGMTKELIIKTGSMFFSKYTGITDPKELKEFYDKLQLLSMLNITLMPGVGAKSAIELGDHIANNVLRAVVLPNVEAIKATFKELSQKYSQV